MAFKSLSELDEYQLVNSDQDCRGWDVVDATGTQIGKVREMFVDAESERVTALALDSGAQILVNQVVLRDGKVVAADGAVAGAAGPTATGTAAVPDSVVDGNLVVPVVEEEIRVGKREVDRVGARVTTRVVETPIQESVSLRDEQVHVERRPVDRLVKEGAIADFEEGIVEVLASSEEAVVTKQARVVEEVVISKSAAEREEVVRDTVKRTKVDVDQIGADHDQPKRWT